MLDVGQANQTVEDDADLAVFVERLAAAGSDQATSIAGAQIVQALADGAIPPGLRRLAEALAASVSVSPPPPRRPAEDASVVAAVRDNALVVLEGFDNPAAAGAVAALLADGRRIVVTAATPAELDAVRDAIPAGAVDRTLTELPALSPADLRELRRLLATSTPARRARAGQEQLPPESALPPAGEVAELCDLAVHAKTPEGAAWMVPALLERLDAKRLEAVTSVAQCVERSLTDLPPRSRQTWAWLLLSELIYSRRRSAFDQMVEETAQAVAAVERVRRGPAVSFVDTPPPDAIEALRRYQDFLAAGGRTRSVFRSPAQREARPALDLARVGSQVPETEKDLQRVIEHLELVERRDRIEAGCRELGLPAPRDEEELAELADVLVKVGAAARSVGALRHDVLFLAPDSPLAVPDVESAAQIATAILDFGEHGAAAEAARRLDALAAALDAHYPGAPEQDIAAAALRSRDADAYATAADALGAARRDARDEALCTALLQRLTDSAPQLAAAWAMLADTEPAALGIASFVPDDSLLSALPPPDTADVVLVLGAGTLGVERLLLTAVAPRLIAVTGPEEQADPPTLVSVLQRASALVIRGQSGVGGRVVPISGAAARAAATAVGQAG